MWNIALLILFIVHLTVFSILYIKRKDRKYIGPVITFILLVTSYGLKIGASDIVFGSIPLFEIVRYLAWGTLAGSIIYRLSWYSPKPQLEG
ncbi:MAG: hypothetical protein OCD01_00290 [Fibrobacterales bacterium]